MSVQIATFLLFFFLLFLGAKTLISFGTLYYEFTFAFRIAVEALHPVCLVDRPFSYRAPDKGLHKLYFGSFF